MTPANILIILGLVLNTLGSILAIYPFINITRKVEDDFITKMDSSGNYTQLKHLKDRKLGIWAFGLFALGFVLQIAGILIDIK